MSPSFRAFFYVGAGSYKTSDTPSIARSNRLAFNNADLISGVDLLPDGQPCLEPAAYRRPQDALFCETGDVSGYAGVRFSGSAGNDPSQMMPPVGFNDQVNIAACRKPGAETNDQRRFCEARAQVLFS